MTAKDEWRSLPWKQFQVEVSKLQTRIYRASQRGDVKTVHKLQRLLMNSWAAKCLAVRKVTQDNRGKKTAGVDGVKALAPAERLALARTLCPSARALPTRRVWIPKPGKVEKRPLGIPTIRDRAAQTLARLALEPEWEARFEPNSYGFRPGRSVHDAMRAVFEDVQRKPKYVLDADIAACFDRINHDALLTKLRTFPRLRRAIRAWLKAGVMDGKELFPTEEGTPQGGAISPLLANVALHGLETAIRSAFTAVKFRDGRRISAQWKPLVVRYADDFVVFHEDLGVIGQVQQIASTWLAGMGLELKPSKTRVTHTLLAHAGNAPGFDFLGFHVRTYPTPRRDLARKLRKQEPTGPITLIKPSAEAQKRHLARIATVVRRLHGAPQHVLIAQLNPVIIGWANFYARQASSEVFQRLDHLVYQKLRRWAFRRHHTKSRTWCISKYWCTLGKDRWVFGATDGAHLAKHARPIQKHTKVAGDASPYNGDRLYWATRLGQHPDLPRSKAWLLKRQEGRCAWCGLLFTDVNEVLETDHRTPRSRGGSHAMDNRQLVHGHCHDAKTAGDGSLLRRTGSPTTANPEVPVSRAKDEYRRRSRMRGNSHVRFCRQAAGGVTLPA